MICPVTRSECQLRCNLQLGNCLAPAPVMVESRPPSPYARVAAPHPYGPLGEVLAQAKAQAEIGKGRERHASGEPFDQQPIVTIGVDLGSNHFELGQAIKKIRESVRLGPSQARFELLGAINYLAAACLVLAELDARK